MERLTRAQIDELCAFDSPTICNALEVFGLRPNSEGIMKPGMELRVKPAKIVAGYAATAKVSANFPDADAHAMLMGYYEHVREMADPTIAVIQDTDPEPIGSFWGEVQATVHTALGCVGAVVHGGVRDVDEAGAMGFQFHSTQLHVTHSYTHIEKYACPVRILGLAVRPGDLLHMDQHGVVNIPHEAAPKLAAVCRKIAEAELPMLEPCRQAIKEGRKPTMQELSAWRSAMADARKAASSLL